MQFSMLMGLSQFLECKEIQKYYQGCVNTMKKQNVWRLIQRSLAGLQRLQWKLMLSYMVTTMITLVIFELVGVLLIAQFVIAKYPKIVTDSLQQEVEQAAQYFAKGPPNKDDLTGFLQGSDGNLQSAYINQGPGVSVSIDIEPGFSVVVNKAGQVLATTNGDAAPAGSQVQNKLSGNELEELKAAQAGQIKGSYTDSNGARQVVVAAAPIVDQDHHVVAVILTRQAIPSLWKVLTAVFPLVWPSLLLVTSLAGVVGCVFGFFMSLWLTQRFKKVSRAARNWSEGNFTSSIVDRSVDEIGELAGQLNTMAHELEKLLMERQRLAMLEERNRLARDLHDSVKQQIFAISMQVGSAQELLVCNDVVATKERLGEIDHLIYEVQQELAALIQQLRPSVLGDKSLQSALRDYSTEWAQQHAIAVEIQMDECPMLTAQVEEAIFRIVQEALNNIARHGKASLVQIQLQCENNQITCWITDDGQGFDTNIAAERRVGLQSMRERAVALNGSLRITSIFGEGTQVMAAFPYRAASTALPQEGNTNGAKRADPRPAR
ncbi:MAG: hypothetical protein PVS3B1_14450 [Ktedonobacteraceae bacterium]